MSTTVFDYRGTYDENLPLPAFLTLEQYRHVIFRPDAHFVDGRIVPRQLGEQDHSRMVGAVSSAIHEADTADQHSLCISLRLQTSSTRIRVCDLVLFSPAAQREAVPTIAPLLCIEILASGQAADSEWDTLQDYLHMGVPNIWLIDPQRRAAYTFDTSGLHEADPANLTVPGTPIHVDLTSPFAKLD